MFILLAIFHTWEKPKNIREGGIYTLCSPRLSSHWFIPQKPTYRNTAQRVNNCMKSLKKGSNILPSHQTPTLPSVWGCGGGGGGIPEICSLNRKSCHLLHYECNIYLSTIYRKVLTLSNVQYATHKHQEHLHQCVRACASPSHRRRGPTVQYRNISENIITPLQDDFELF